MLTNTKHSWGSISIGLHWLTVILVLGLAIVGLIMTELPTSPLKMQIYALHKSFGLTVLALTAFRLVWRLLAGSPDEIPSTRIQSWVAKLVHGLMYILLFTIPLSGWLYNSASGFPLRWFGLVSLPKLFTGYDPAIKQLAHDTHETLFYVLASLILIHAIAGLWHHYVLRDTILKRMLGRKS
jgi:cytochrome b561